MRKLIAIGMLLLLVTTYTELGQLLRVPLLLQHYSKHRMNENGLSFLHFLKDHYTGAHNDDDQAEDRQLPFKSAYDHPVSLLVITPLAEGREVLRCWSPIKYPRLASPPLPRSAHSIFHPPQLA
jgi:hypothetical protein